jgi:hypothetical protein
VQLLLAPFASVDRLVIFGTAAFLAAIIVGIVLRSARTAEDPGSGWARVFARPSAKYLFGALFVAWALVFGIGLQLVPHQGANSPYGAIGLLALFSGTFLMFGFLWAVIGE